jgi:hypothetical protein
MDEHRLGDSEAAPVVSVAEAARRLGRTVDGVRGLVRRGKLSAKRGNDGKLLIVLPTGGDEAATGGDEADDEAGALALLRDQLEEIRDQLENWRLAAEEARLALAKAEGERDAAQAVALAKEQAAERLIAELRAQLTEARRPWWARMISRH